MALFLFYVYFRVISISSCVRSYPYSIALRYLQRKAIMLDPNWQKGYYYNTGKFPRTGMKLARLVTQGLPYNMILGYFTLYVCGNKATLFLFQGDSYFNIQRWR